MACTPRWRRSARAAATVVVEGNFDVLALHEAGIEEAVAPMGTALTVEQVAELGRLAKTVTVVFDGDSAGQRAAQKAVPLFVDGEVDGRVARLPAGFDPDDFVRRSDDGAATFRRMVDGARPMLDQFIQDSVEESSIEGKMATLERVAELLVRVRNQTKRELYAGQLAGVLGADDPSGQARAAGGRHARPPRQPRGAERRGEQPPAPSGRRRHRPGAAAAGRAARHRAARALPGAAARARGRPRRRAAGAPDASPASPDGRRDGRRDRQAGRPGLAGRRARPQQRKTVAAGLMDGSLAEVADPPGLLRKLATRLELSAGGRRDRDERAAVAGGPRARGRGGAARAVDPRNRAS